MVYKVIGIMSGSSLDGLDIVFAALQVESGNWSFEIIHSDCYAYDRIWYQRLKDATQLNASDYLLLHTDYGHYIGREVNRFVESHGLQYQVALVSSHGHTTFHMPERKMTGQLGDGAAIASETGLPVVTDLRAMDVAFGGQGAPIVPIGERLLLKEYSMFLNLGGIANISVNLPDRYIAFDVCAANRILNMLSAKEGKEFDEGGRRAASGKIDDHLLQQLNALDYYSKPFPKSLANSFGVEQVFPLVEAAGLTVADSLRTYVAHIVQQIKNALQMTGRPGSVSSKMLVTGGGAFNDFMVQELRRALQPSQVEVVVPDAQLVNYKEALIMGLMGVLRWRQEYNVLHSVTGATRDSIGGAVWIGQEA